MSDHRLDRIHADDFITQAILEAEYDALSDSGRLCLGCHADAGLYSDGYCVDCTDEESDI
jgi:hypothetical protein